MKPKSYDEIWQKKHVQKMWTIPDHDVVALLDTLKRKKVKRILDVGFGLGRHVVLFTKEGFETYGIDISQSGFDYCTKWLKVEGLTANLQMGDMLSLPYEKAFFDFVIAYNVVYHGIFLQMNKALAEIHRVLRQGGLVYITLYSVRNSNYRVGTEIEPNTFLNPKKHDGDFPHHFSDEQEVRSLFQNWKIINLKDREQTLAGKIYKDTYHWLIIASKR